MEKLGAPAEVPTLQQVPRLVKTLQATTAVLLIGIFAGCGTLERLASENSDAQSAGVPESERKEVEGLIKQVGEKYQHDPKLSSELHFTKKLQYLLSPEFEKDCVQAGIDPATMRRKLLGNLRRDLLTLLQKNPTDYLAENNAKQQAFDTLSRHINQLIEQRERELGMLARTAAKGKIQSALDPLISEGNRILENLLGNSTNPKELARTVQKFTGQAERALQVSRNRSLVHSAK